MDEKGHIIDFKNSIKIMNAPNYDTRLSYEAAIIQNYKTCNIQIKNNDMVYNQLVYDSISGKVKNCLDTMFGKKVN